MQWSRRYRARWLVGLAAVGLMGLVCSKASAAEEGPPLFHPSIARVAVFKNGYVFTFREGQAAARDGWVATTDVPAGVLGTVWGYADGGASVTELLASETEGTEKRKAESMQELLMLNEGSSVRVTAGDKTYEGILEVLAPRPRPTPPEEDSSPAEPPAAINSQAFDVAVKTEHGVQIMDLSRITHFEFTGEPKWDKEVPVKRRMLRLKLDGLGAPGDGGKPRVGVAALERGIRWIPGYRIALLGDREKQARVDLEASIVNDLADIQDAEFNFVVGVPHFLMSDTLSPLSLRTAFTGLSGYFSDSGRRGEGALMGQFAYGNSASPTQANGGSAAAPPLTLAEDSLPTLSAEQLFLYQAQHLSLKKGNRASLRLFSLTVPCQEVYEWTLLDPPSASNSYRQSSRDGSAGGLDSLADRIWYALKLKNSSTMPWTTGPAASFREWKPMGQDIMPFTAVGGEAVLKVTPATEVAGEHQQQEKERQRQALMVEGNRYDLVTVEGTIKVTNIKKVPVTVCLTRKTDGEITAASDGGKISREGFELQAVNPHSVVSWELTLPPGEKQVTYTYRRYVAQ